MKRYPVLLIVLLLPPLLFALNHFVWPVFLIMLYGFVPFLALLKINVLMIGLLLAVLWRLQFQSPGSRKSLCLFSLILLAWVFIVPDGILLLLGVVALIAITRTLVARQSILGFLLGFGVTVLCGYLFLSSIFFSMTLGVVLFLLSQMFLDLRVEQSAQATVSRDKFWQAHQLAREVLTTR